MGIVAWENRTERVRELLLYCRGFFFWSCSWVFVESRKYKDLEEVYDLEQYSHFQYLVVEILAVLINKACFLLVYSCRLVERLVVSHSHVDWGYCSLPSCCEQYVENRSNMWRVLDPLGDSSM